MAIDSFFLSLLVKTVTHRRRTVSDRPLKALALAYPDFLVPRAMIEEVCGPDILAKLREVENAES